MVLFPKDLADTYISMYPEYETQRQTDGSLSSSSSHSPAGGQEEKRRAARMIKLKQEKKDLEQEGKINEEVGIKVLAEIEVGGHK
jgi:hypothetical protein